MGQLGELHCDDTGIRLDRSIETDAPSAYLLCRQLRSTDQRGFNAAAVGSNALDDDLTAAWFKMLVQQPHSEPLPRFGGDEVLAEFAKTRTIALRQGTDVGSVHVEQLRVVLYVVITYHQHL